MGSNSSPTRLKDQKNNEVTPNKLVCRATPLMGSFGSHHRRAWRQMINGHGWLSKPGWGRMGYTFVHSRYSNKKAKDTTYKRDRSYKMRKTCFSYPCCVFLLFTSLLAGFLALNVWSSLQVTHPHCHADMISLKCRESSRQTCRLTCPNFLIREVMSQKK